MIASALQRLPFLHEILMRPAARQLLRYAFAGFCVTQFAACIYAALVTFGHIPAFRANMMSASCGLIVGYVVHSRWSLAGGTAPTEHGKVGRFLLSSSLAFAINSLWVWLLVSNLHLPPLAPIPLMMGATPLMSFLLNRYWVFKAA